MEPVRVLVPISLLLCEGACAALMGLSDTAVVALVEAVKKQLLMAFQPFNRFSNEWINSGLINSSVIHG